MIKSYTQEDLAKITATPAALGVHIGEKFMGQPYRPYPWVLHMEQQILSMLYRPGNEVLVVSVPAQSGKTTYCGLLLPLWYLGRHPNHQVMLISYNEKQAGKWGLRVRNAMQQYGHALFGTEVSGDSTSTVDWKMGNGFGGMMSTGIEGGISGNPGHLIVADDLIKNADEANSPAIQKRNMDDWDQSVMTRLQDNTKVLLIATRWNDQDVSGEVIAKSMEEGYSGITVNTLNIKALAEPDPEEQRFMDEHDLEEWRDFLGRRHGEGLKGQHSQRFFEMRRGSMSPRAWSAMYQGVPSHIEGGMFPESNWGYYTRDGETRVDAAVDLPHMNQRVRIWDIASSEGAGDWTVGTLLGRDRDNRVFILDRQRFRHAPGGVEQKIKDTATSDGYETTILIEEERHGAGKTVFAHYKEELIGYRVEKAKAEGDKESRATPYSIIQNQKRVFLPYHATWLREWIQEHAQMDGRGGRPKHDDQIDTAAYGVRFLIGGGDSAIVSIFDMQASAEASPEEQLEMAAMRRAVGL